VPWDRTRTAPGDMGKSGLRRPLIGHLTEFVEDDCDKPVEGGRSCIAISKLSRNTHISVASLTDGADSAAFTPLSATDASVSKTLALSPRENTSVGGLF
jgi:hypothetical protein